VVATQQGYGVDALASTTDAPFAGERASGHSTVPPPPIAWVLNDEPAWYRRRPRKKSGERGAFEVPLR
jgi:hypothetical protein